MDRRKLALGAIMLTMLLTFICINSGRTQAAIPAHIPIDGIFKPSIGVDSSVQAGGIVQVTPDSQNKKGAIWSEEQYKIDLTHNFTSLMYVNLGDKKAQSVDGTAFAMMNDPDKVKNWQQVTGGALGVWRNPFSWVKDNSAIAKSFAVEFDTYHNGNDFDGLLPNDGPDRGHVAYNFPGQDSAYQRLPSRLYALNHLQLQKPQNGDYLSLVTLGHIVMAPSVQAATTSNETTTRKIALEAGDTTTTNPPIVPGTDGNGNGPTGATGDITIDNLTPLDFGKVKLTGGAQNVKNIVKDPNVQVTDKRGTGAGWNITVKSSEFKDTTDSTHILKGAQINFPVGKVVASDSTNTAAPTAKAITVPADGLDNAQILMSADKDKGMGTWADVMTTDGITLDIAGGAYAGSYNADLTWTLGDTPLQLAGSSR